MRDASGVINIYKEKGYTSHDVVAIVRKATGMKTGHTGTLDPQAEGVLPICVGKATRIAGYITSSDKEYRAELILGKTTDTDDTSGSMLEMRHVDFDQDMIKEAISSFEGEYMQTPPMYSALKVNGKKLYELAREGKTVERKERLVVIDSITVEQFDEAKNTVVIHVTCSKGTYIRSLCADIGRILGCGGCMGDLLRLRTGTFRLEDSIRLDELKHIISNDELYKVLQPIDTVLPYKKVIIGSEGHKFLMNGNKIKMSYLTTEIPEHGEKVLVYSYCDSKNVLGLYEAVVESEPFLKAVTLFL